MKDAKVIPFPIQRVEPPRPGFDYEAYERRAQQRFRRAGLCLWLNALVEAVVTAAIGLSVLLSAAAFLAIL